MRVCPLFVETGFCRVSDGLFPILVIDSVFVATYFRAGKDEFTFFGVIVLFSFATRVCASLVFSAARVSITSGCFIAELVFEASELFAIAL